MKDNEGLDDPATVPLLCFWQIRRTLCVRVQSMTQRASGILAEPWAHVYSVCAFTFKKKMEQYLLPKVNFREKKMKKWKYAYIL